MKKLLLFGLFAMVFSAFTANAQVNGFPYSNSWTNPTAFVKQSDGRTYIGGDGNWQTYIVGNKPQWTTDAGAGTVKTNSNNTDDTLLVLVDATGLNFSGGETFSFLAARAGGPGPNGTMTITAGTTTIVEQVATDLTTSNQPFSLSLPSELSNSVFSIFIIVNSNKQVVVDTTQLFGGALPVQLSSFLATSITNNRVTLSWTTISEVNNYGFYVRRDGIDITFIAGNGTTLQHHTYSYTDNPSSGAHNYQLKQVDLNGTNTFSEIIMVNVPSEFVLGQNYPNPFNPSTTIKYELPTSSLVKLSVYDILGSEVAVLVNKRENAGKYEVTLDGSKLASGVYFYRLQAGDFTQTKRLLLLK